MYVRTIIETYIPSKHKIIREFVIIMLLNKKKTELVTPKYLKKQLMENIIIF